MVTFFEGDIIKDGGTPYDNIIVSGEEDLNEPPIKTVGDLLTYGYGLWADRDDIADSLI